MYLRDSKTVVIKIGSLLKGTVSFAIGPLKKYLNRLCNLANDEYSYPFGASSGVYGGAPLGNTLTTVSSNATLNISFSAGVEFCCR